MFEQAQFFLSKSLGGKHFLCTFALSIRKKTMIGIINYGKNEGRCMMVGLKEEELRLMTRLVKDYAREIAADVECKKYSKEEGDMVFSLNRRLSEAKVIDD